MKLKNYYYINKYQENFTDSLIGETGNQGMKGFKGPPGDVGLKGLKGEIGDKGLSGPRGEAGKIGNKGDKGSQGKLGETGDDGDKGIKGLQGISGDKGDKGDTGDLGDEGDRGLKGSKGPTGDKGPKGQSGHSFVSQHDLEFYPEEWDGLVWKKIYTVDPSEGGATGNIKPTDVCDEGKVMVGLRSSYHKHEMLQQKAKMKKGNISYEKNKSETAYQVSRNYDIACAKIPKIILNTDKTYKYIHQEWSNETEYTDEKVKRYPFWPPTQ